MKKIMVLLAIVFIVVFICNDNSVIVIPNEAIRIRVIANSNSFEDQLLKKKVRKNIQLQLNELLKDANDIDSVRKILNENLKDIEFTVKESLPKNNRKFNVNYGLNYFPNKNFKGIEYDEGYYESILITLGSGIGDNWWCVLFPPLCLMEEEENKYEKIEYKSFVKEMLDKYF